MPLACAYVKYDRFDTEFHTSMVPFIVGMELPWGLVCCSSAAQGGQSERHFIHFGVLTYTASFRHSLISTSSTAQGTGGSFKDRKPIGCESL